LVVGRRQARARGDGVRAPVQLARRLDRLLRLGRRAAGRAGRAPDPARGGLMTSQSAKDGARGPREPRDAETPPMGAPRTEPEGARHEPYEVFESETDALSIEQLKDLWERFRSHPAVSKVLGASGLGLEQA